jgi:hypothetical protein
MGNGLIWISENSAQGHWEACQAAMMFQIFLALETGYPANFAELNADCQNDII